LYRPAWSDYALLLFLLWTPLDFFRQMRALSPDGGLTEPVDKAALLSPVLLLVALAATGAITTLALKRRTA
jgi:hypothetical protein